MTRISSTVTIYAIVLFAAGALYGLSCAPGALWQDSGLIQYRVWHNDVEGFLGLAISHPLYYLVAIAAKYIPLGEFGYRVNCVSGVAGAVAIANLYLLVRLWLGRDFPALIAAGTLALSHTFWRHASIAETYTLWTALFLAELIMLLQYTKTKSVAYLYLLGLLNGLAVAVHMLGSIPLVCYVALIVFLLARKAIHARHVAVIAALWIIGAMPFEYLIIKNLVHSGDLLGTLASVAFGDRWRADVLNASLSWSIVRENILFILLNFPTPNALLFLAGLYGFHRIGATSVFRNVVLALLVLFFLFAARYTISDRYAFFIPFYSTVAIIIGLGAHEVCSRIGSRPMPGVIVACVFMPVGVYAVAPALAERLHIRIGTRQDVPYRNDYEYFLQPWKTTDRGAERFAREAFESVEDDAVICADTTTVGPLLYVQEVKGVRPDVKVVTGIARSKAAPVVNEGTIGQLLETRPVYVVSTKRGYAPACLLDRYALVRAGVLWRVVEK